MAYHLTIKGDHMRFGLILSLTTYAAAALYLSGCGVTGSLKTYRVDEYREESRQYRADNKPLWCVLVPYGCKKSPKHLETQDDGEVSGS
jgi:hypothetical protein